MNIEWQVIVFGIAVGGVAIWLWHISRREKPPAAPFTGNVDDTPHTIDEFVVDKSNIPSGSLETEVRMLIDYGNKPEAIRVLRARMGLDLKDAKDLAERIEQGARIPLEALEGAIAAGGDDDQEVRDMVHNGQLIEAIKLVREQKGLDLKAARAYVERL
jgi:ribosomal protein L7/L12